MDRRKAVLLLWAFVAWVAPAAIAGALGWKGIWGSGSAWADYLVPFPVAGGVFHLPSFIVVSLVVFSQPWAGKRGGWVRGLLLAGMLVGLAMLLDLNQLHLAATADGTTGARLWQPMPLGLFIASDCAIAQLFIGMAGGRWPAGMQEWAVSLLMPLAIPALYAATSLQADPRQRNPFVYTGTHAAETRGDARVFYYAKLPPGSDAFRQAAWAVLEQHDPRMNMNDEDIAIHFYDSLAAAQAQRQDRAAYTVCLYQDGTATAWHRGSADCFRDHESFSERLEKAFGAQDPSLPQDVRLWLARRGACTGRKPLVAPLGIAHMDNQETRSCDAERSRRTRKALVGRFAQDERALAALR